MLLAVSKSSDKGVPKKRGALRKKFAADFQEKSINIGGAMPTDAVTLKIQGKHFYDLTMQHMRITAETFHDSPSFEIQNSMFLFVEGLSVANAYNIRAKLDEELQRQYGVSLSSLTQFHAMFTDGAAVMARVAGSSVSPNIAQIDHKWMRCGVHILNNLMKDVIADCSGHPVLGVLAQDFKSMKRIMEDSKRGGWNSFLPNGYRLIKEVNTRVCTHFFVAERFFEGSGQSFFSDKRQ